MGLGQPKGNRFCPQAKGVNWLGNGFQAVFFGIGRTARPHRGADIDHHFAPFGVLVFHGFENGQMGLASRVGGFMEEERSPLRLHNIEFVDIHCHILPGLDDGPSHWQESLRMAQIAVAEGVTTVVATPHQLGNYPHNTVSRIRGRWEEFCSRLASEGIPLRVELGADIRLEPELPEKIANGEVLPIGDHGRYVLVELPSDSCCAVENLLKKLRRIGVTPILTHPERSVVIARNQKFLRQWVAGGGLIQITGGSLTGSFGLVVQSAAERLLGEGLVHLVASDAHGATRRRPLWRRVYERLAELGGPDWADRLCRENPARVLAGQQVLEVPPISIGFFPKLFAMFSRKAG